MQNLLSYLSEWIFLTKWFSKNTWSSKSFINWGMPLLCSYLLWSVVEFDIFWIMTKFFCFLARIRFLRFNFFWVFGNVILVEKRIVFTIWLHYPRVLFSIWFLFTHFVKPWLKTVELEKPDVQSMQNDKDYADLLDMYTRV